jgi:hypothetical protein
MNLSRGPMAGVETKQCTLCKQHLPASAFYAGPKRKGGLYPWCRTCSVKKAREYNDANPGWREHKKAYDRARVERLKEKLRVQNRERYERNREKIIAQTKVYQSARPEQVRATKQAYKHRRRAIERAGMSGRELLEWKSAQPKVCHWCGAKCARGYVVDHVQPLAKGGKHEDDPPSPR